MTIEEAWARHVHGEGADMDDCEWCANQVRRVMAVIGPMLGVENA